MKIYTRHVCERRHRSWQTFAACVWPRAAWICGRGPYASVAWCRPVTVWLYEDPARAQRAVELIDATACGRTCSGRHELIRLAPRPDALTLVA